MRATPGTGARYWLVWFERRGPACYLSHLDTARALQRTFARAGIELALSEGFRPKARLSLPLPLPVGAAGVRELAVTQVAQTAPAPAGALRALRAAAPVGLTPTGLVETQARPRPRARLARYRCVLRGEPTALAGAARWFASQEEVVVERVAPKGRRTLDLKRYVEDLTVQAVAGGVQVQFTVRHRSDGAARPQEVCDLLAARAGCPAVIHRLMRCAVSYEGLPGDTCAGDEE